MDRNEFERLRDLSGKTIRGDITLRRRRPSSSEFVSDKIPIENSANVDATLAVSWNEETEAKTFNVIVRGLGPICRLEVDSRPHRPAGRSHKHALRDRDCPTENLRRDVIDRPDLNGSSLIDAMAAFASMSGIAFLGRIEPELDT